MKYQIILADPPWGQTKGGIRKVRMHQGTNLDYPTLDTFTIFTILDDFINRLLGTPNIVFLWTIDKFLLESECLMLERGYKRHARIIWDKENGVAPAFTIRYAHEYLLWFYKGNLLPIEKSMRGKFTTIIREKSVKHSQKPIKAYEMIEAFYPTQNKLELFARNKRQGWDVWGNEVESDIKLISAEDKSKAKLHIEGL